MTGVNFAVAFVGGAVLLSPFAAIAVDVEENPAAVELDPDYAAGKKAIEAKQWSAAIAALSSAALRDTRNADVQNYLGYAYRNAGQLDAAFRHYERALTLSPRHRGAHEILNNLAKGRAPRGAATDLLDSLRRVRGIEGEDRNLQTYRQAVAAS
jgi:Flp pilus assembly protein TadD